MNHTIFSLVTAAPLLLCLSACDRNTTLTTPTNTTSSSASSLATLSTETTAKDIETNNIAAIDKEFITDKWIGQWNGPEGTFLRIDGNAGHYNLTIQNLDGPLSYTGIGVGEKIQFERNGVKETIHASNGAETGMKWLSDKSNCLTIRAGEGYCKR